MTNSVHLRLKKHNRCVCLRRKFTHTHFFLPVVSNQPHPTGTTNSYIQCVQTADMSHKYYKRRTTHTNTIKSNLCLLILKYLNFSTKQSQVPASFTHTSKFRRLSSGVIQETPEDSQCYDKLQRLQWPSSSVNRCALRMSVCLSVHCHL